MENKFIFCPFCEEKYFDKIALKYHIIKYCEMYEDIPMTTLHDYRIRKGLTDKK